MLHCPGGQVAGLLVVERLSLPLLVVKLCSLPKRDLPAESRAFGTGGPNSGAPVPRMPRFLAHWERVESGDQTCRAVAMG